MHARPGTDTDTYANPDGNADADSDAYTDGNANPDTNCDAYTDPDSDAGWYMHADVDG